MNAAAPLSEEAIQARKRRNLWLAWALVAMIVLVMVITMVRLSEGTHREADRREAEGLSPVATPNQGERNP